MMWARAAIAPIASSCASGPRRRRPRARPWRWRGGPPRRAAGRGGRRPAWAAASRSRAAAWDLSAGDSSVIIAILDTGVLASHPDLGGTVAGLPGQIWTNWAEANGSPGVDDDGDGLIDDVHGWDFVNLLGSGGVTPGED